MLRYISIRLFLHGSRIWLVVSWFSADPSCSRDPIQQMLGEGAAAADIQAARPPTDSMSRCQNNM